MKRGITIRPAAYADLQVIASLHAASWQQAYAGLLPQEALDALKPDSMLAQWEAIYFGRTAEDSHMLLAYYKKEPVGFASFGRARDASLSGQGEIYAIYLVQEAWGKGIGHALYNTMVKGFRAEGRTQCYLWALEHNTQALRAYARWGGQTDTRLAKNETLAGKPFTTVMVQFPL